MASFGFSVGDFIAGIKLVIGVVQAVRSSGGSKEDLQSLDRSICKLKGSIECGRNQLRSDVLKKLRLADATLDEHALAVEASLQACEKAIESFECDTQTYRDAFGLGSANSGSTGAGGAGSSGPNSANARPAKTAGKAGPYSFRNKIQKRTGRLSTKIGKGLQKVVVAPWKSIQYSQSIDNILKELETKLGLAERECRQQETILDR